MLRKIHSHYLRWYPSSKVCGYDIYNPVLLWLSYPVVCRKLNALAVTKSASRTHDQLFPPSAARRNIIRKPSIDADQQPYVDEDDEVVKPNVVGSKYVPDRRGRIRMDWSELEITWLTNWVQKQDSGKHLNWNRCVSQIQADSSVRVTFENNCHLCKDKLREKYRRLKAEGVVQ